MINAGRGEQLYITAKAAHLLAAGYGYGSGWTRDYIFGKPQLWRPGASGDESTPAVAAGLHVARETETLELAHRAIHPRKLPRWVERLPASQRDDVMAWSESHPLTGGGAQRAREFEHWQTSVSYVCVPKVRSGADAAGALGMASLPGPLRAVLELYALQRMEHVDQVLRCLVTCGAGPEIARDALTRWLWPELVPTFGECAKARHMRKADYHRAVNASIGRLRGWLHRASLAYLHAHGNPKAHIFGVISRKEARRPVTSTLARRAA